MPIDEDTGIMDGVADAHDALSPESACEALAQVGLRFSAADLHVEAREDRWVARLPGGLLAWFAQSERGARRLATERRVLRLLESRCTFGAPRLLLESADGAFDVREMVPGVSDPWRIFAEVVDSARLAAQIGAAIGSILAEQHARIGKSDVADWLPHRPEWPEPREWVEQRLPRVIDDPELIADAAAIMEAYEGVPVAEADRAFVHTDVGFHNLGIDPDTHVVHGIFDYDGAAWADRHHDFRYLVFDRDRDELLEAALAVYEDALGLRVDRKRVLLYNAACALTFLAFREGKRPDERSCGRTLAEDLSWSRHAIDRATRA